MKVTLHVAAHLFSLLFIVAVHAAPPPQMTGKAWEDMDYGPYKSTTVELHEEAGNFAYKAVVIPLNKERTASVVFDTDTLRYAAGWQGWLELKGVDFDGSHWTYPKTKGVMTYSNAVGPGWGDPAKGEGEKGFVDPRFRGNDKKPYGPLPREWGHWKGLYLHGETVVLSYTVGGVMVLETPGLEKIDAVEVFTRTLNIAPSTKPMVLQVAREAGRRAEPFELKEGKLVASAGGDASRAIMTSGDALGAERKAGETIIGIGAVSEATISWIGKGDEIRLVIAAHDKPIRIKVLTWRGEVDKLATFAAAVSKAEPASDLSKLTQGGPPRWDRTLTTQAKMGEAKKDSPYAIDLISWPHDNPWKAWMRFGGFDFFKDGKRAAICTWSGDVWIVEGIAAGEAMGELKWRRIATGMFQPLGIKIVDKQIYVSCRDQITRLVDLNGDGETDFYENFNNDHQVTEHFHEFAMDLQTDKDGNFYYAKSARHARDSLVQQHGTLMKVSRDGSKSEIIANGYRAANGVGVGPDGVFFTSDQEGHWMPANRINLVKQGSFSGNMFSYHMGEKPKDYDRPIVWLPKGIDRSPAEQVWVTSDKWGLAKDSLISLSYGTGFMQQVMYENVEGIDPRVQVQGAFHRLPVQFPTGVMRGRFHPADGQLYACGLFGWSSNQTQPGGFYRVRYTGKPLIVPTKFLAATDGVVLHFSGAVDAEVAADAGSYLVEQWDYKWTGNYGSPEFKLSDGNKGRDTLEVKSARVSKDGRRVWLELPGLKPSMQLRIKYDLDSAAGDALAEDLYGSVHVIPKRSGAQLLEAKGG